MEDEWRSLSSGRSWREFGCIRRLDVVCKRCVFRKSGSSCLSEILVCGRKSPRNVCGRKTFKRGLRAEDLKKAEEFGVKQRKPGKRIRRFTKSKLLKANSLRLEGDSLVLEDVS
ncbi:hypothetical protein M8J76_009377 [Diaphorina citri]|nr:hypothetical protein M8J76_009377 [Diaphorina citri]